MTVTLDLSMPPIRVTRHIPKCTRTLVGMRPGETAAALRGTVAELMTGTRAKDCGGSRGACEAVSGSRGQEAGGQGEVIR